MSGCQYFSGMAPIHTNKVNSPRLTKSLEMKKHPRQEVCELRTTHFPRGHRKLTVSRFPQSRRMTVDLYVVRRIRKNKRRDTKVEKFNGGILFTYGPLAYFLKNRVYIGETGHKDKWFPGEHAGIVDLKTFDQVQQLLKSKSEGRDATRTASEALLLGKLYDDKGNRMSPSYSTKNGVRYRFYVSSALLRGRKTDAGSVGRVSAAEIESAVLTALQTHQGREETNNGQDPFGAVERAVISRNQLMLTKIGSDGATNIDRGLEEIKVAWSITTKDSAPVLESDGSPDGSHNEVLIQSIVRAHVWMHSLREGTYESIEDLADANGLHPKVVRQALRLAFLSPEVTSAVLEGRQPAGLALAQITKLLPLQWTEHQRMLG
jgi:site-specific DNA recombinase